MSTTFQRAVHGASVRLGPGYLTVSPSGTALPLALDLNYATSETRANLAIVRVGTGGNISIYSPTTTHVIVDLAGWIS